MENNQIDPELIAICGMNCRLCSAFQREKNRCLGCRQKIGARFPSCDRCRIRNCEQAITGNFSFCSECESYPCALIKHLDKRYRTKYSMSMIANLDMIKRSGLQVFLTSEEKKWVCPKCGEILSVHKPYCLSCQHTWREKELK